MRVLASIITAASALLLLQSVAPCAAAELDIRVQGGRAPVGNAPPKSPRGEKDTVAVVGEATGETEFLIADEISNAVASGQEGGPNGEVALRVLAMPGKGGLQNVRDVLTRQNLDFGIVPVPVLEGATRIDGMANLRQRIAYVAPLYIEEVHLVARSGVKDVAELAGKTVSVGEEGGSTEYLAREVLGKLGISVSQANLDTRTALAAVRDGSVAAAFVVSGKPVQTLSGVPGAGLRILPLPESGIPDGFVPSTLTHEDYPDFVRPGSTVSTYGVQNVLVGYNWPARSPRGQAGQTFLSILMYRLPELQVGSRHPKWREINVAATLPGWKRLPSMESWLAKAKPRLDNSTDESSFEGFLKRNNTQVTGENREALYKDYVRWRGSPAGQASR